MSEKPLFVRAGGVMINSDKLLSLKHYPKIDQGAFRQDEHYRAVFDGSDKELWLEPEQGKAIIVYLGVDCAG